MNLGGMIASKLNFGGQKEEKAWKRRLSKKGIMIPIPAKEQVRPNKYKPGRGKTFKSPGCFKMGLWKDGDLKRPIRCKTCMWQSNCK
ncbi:hypothetical protein A2Z67_03735 [Candidatus Woesebacteria bacterium RBG_13_36_22]|uniref:Uncharacterized protein n=1 Tax=Candidatus Woesebacteria bacterium RBG_13_36_22 TaxID=1802478 RepID=A0A1F7WZ29_9BACT|nr:MAG: hypothetical protein A2Z67_03735 [Candidatus Woesebacteria bacterium RBG_13_36_22]